MNANKSCRNCRNTEIYSQEVNATGPHGPNPLPVGGVFSVFSAPKFHMRVCGNCGLVEWFVSEKYLGLVKETFPRAPTA
jgi:predicted nucleic-acid-binding Zn-ribbon protein